MKKRRLLSTCLSMCLAVTMALSCAGVTAFAAETDEKEPVTEQQLDEQLDEKEEVPEEDISEENTSEENHAPEEEVALLSAENGLSADDPMVVGAEALVYDSAKGIVGFSKTWYDSLGLNGDTLYVSLAIPAEMNGVPVTKIAY